MNGSEDADPFDRFALSALLAINHFSDHECAALARGIRHKLRQRRASGVYGDEYGHRSLWDEYRFEVRHGPTMALKHAWSLTLDPFLTEQIEKLAHTTAVLLTIAACYRDNDLVPRAGGTTSDDQIGKSILDALYRLADEQNFTARSQD